MRNTLMMGELRVTRKHLLVVQLLSWRLALLDTVPFPWYEAFINAGAYLDLTPRGSEIIISDSGGAALLL